MNNILTIEQAIKLSQQLKTNNKKLVLAGGCFDILHFGHVTFLEKAAELGDILFVFVESDESIKITKGQSRPINMQIERAKIISALKAVNYVILLPFLKNDKEYDKLAKSLSPAIIVATKGDEQVEHKKRQAEMLNAQLIYIEKFGNYTTTKTIEKVKNKK